MLPYPSSRFPLRQAFTLVELLAVIGILALLLAILFPFVGNVLMRADQAKAISNLRQLGTGFHLHATDNNGEWPAPRAGWFQWTKAVYPYVYPKAPPATNADIANPAHVFVSPRADPVAHTDGRLDAGAMGNGNIVGYGYNGRLPTVGPFPASYSNGQKRNPRLLVDPASTALLMDAYNFTATPGSPYVEEGSRRWDGYVMVLFAAGNVDKMAYDELPDSQDTPEGQLFWVGMQTE